MKNNFIPLKNKPTQKATFDEMLIEVEWYNGDTTDVYFLLCEEMKPYIRAHNIPMGPERAILKKGEFITLPHSYYIPVAKDGREFLTLTRNYGDNKGIGNKHQSAPFVEKRLIQK